MMESNKDLPEKIAWNGMSINIPRGWDIDSLDATHMLIGEERSPKIEVKWTDAPKKFTLEKYLKKFISQSQKMLKMKIHELATPDSFSPEPHFEFFFFSWESGASKGNGALIFCSLCKRLTMIRFFSNSRILALSLKASILISFADHPTKNLVHWHLFGLNFSSPLSFQLSEYSFKPGSYVITLNQKKTLLSFFSWGPASFLLSDKTLSEFATTRLPQLKGLAETGVCSQGNTLEWSYRHGRFKNAETLPFMKKFSLYTRFRIIHDPQKNRLFGILVDSPKKIEHDLIKGSRIGVI